ncbi:MAG: exodeoxyribonuclease VII small subunit [Lachnospiraceae bacterium]|jgi:exodeoxyribonuclease VII small subunit|nr:exodeoxyribonuclease VII small subunit [Lachnospiraceae bacterium]MCI9017583.1 exodeoxyribonuclease VII small subunit [Lachnospiraceae bacterium]MCI9305927.1 exodeoxyribonuclease VII small subunit [Lachnospiraceae bacterium]MCI9680650.1 exodeoxyribonuclease VII small subunit [Lachnospiraceae bacterium]
MEKDQREQKEQTLEEAFVRLDQMLEKLSDRDTALEESFQVYAEGTKLLKYCNEKLDKVEKKMLMLSEEGELNEF